MPSLIDQAPIKGNIMVVDDNPANLKLLEDMLRGHGYQVRSFPRGRLALAAAEFAAPDLVLLDINMPEMNGYEVCERLKAHDLLSAIPVVFLSALNAVEDKVKGFHAGGVDFISKPFQFEEVQARVDTQLRLRQAQRAELELLERTLGGAIEALWELVQLTSPALTLHSRSIRDIVLWIAARIKARNAWQYDLAGRLCLIGCIAIPDAVFEKGYRGLALEPEEARMFRAHPETAAHLIRNIPRLEVVAAIVRAQQQPEMAEFAEAREGAQVLHLALEWDGRLYRGMKSPSAIEALRISGRFDARMLEALAAYAPPPVEFEDRSLRIRDLRPGMVLDKDLKNQDGTLLILKAGTVLTSTWIERLQNFSSSGSAHALVGVRVPRFPDTLWRGVKKEGTANE